VTANLLEVMLSLGMQKAKEGVLEDEQVWAVSAATTTMMNLT